jgi:hypothetical protein
MTVAAMRAARRNILGMMECYPVRARPLRWVIVGLWSRCKFSLSRQPRPLASIRIAADPKKRTASIEYLRGKRPTCDIKEFVQR